MDKLYLIIPLIAGYFLDLLLGDPRWLPHPIRTFGTLIYKAERNLNTAPARFFKGMFLTITLSTGVFAFFFFTASFLSTYPILQYPFIAVFVFYSIANMSLIQEGKAVFRALASSLEEGRKRLSWIVGRQTDKLSPQEIKTAVFETLSENLSDGVIAPLFYYAILGIPGAMTYKMINTLDSMIGYKNERYFLFGKFAAYTDDVVNYIPARITAFLILLVSFKLHKLPFVITYGKQHSSPNAGYPEAALAAVLDCRFGGPNYYHGQLVEKPYIGTNPRDIKDYEIKKVAVINQKVTLIFVVLICSLHYFL